MLRLVDFGKLFFVPKRKMCALISLLRYLFRTQPLQSYTANVKRVSVGGLFTSVRTFVV